MNSEKKKKIKYDEENTYPKSEKKQKNGTKAMNDANDTNHIMRIVYEKHQHIREYVNVVEKNEKQGRRMPDVAVMNVSRNHIWFRWNVKNAESNSQEINIKWDI